MSGKDRAVERSAHLHEVQGRCKRPKVRTTMTISQGPYGKTGRGGYVPSSSGRARPRGEFS